MAQDVARAELAGAVASGGKLENESKDSKGRTVTGAAAVEQDVTNAYTGVESINVLDYEKEYLVRPGAGGEFVALNKKKFDDYVKATYANCPAFTALDKNRQKELMDWDKIVESFSWYNESCSK